MTTGLYIYILACDSNMYYVGKTYDIMRRLREHQDQAGKGSDFTKIYKPLRAIRIIENANDYDEDRYTKEYMSIYGIDNVRGGSYVKLTLSKDIKKMIITEFRGASNRCTRCGLSDHFVKLCKKKEFCYDEPKKLIYPVAGGRIPFNNKETTKKIIANGIRRANSRGSLSRSQSNDEINISQIHSTPLNNEISVNKSVKKNLTKKSIETIDKPQKKIAEDLASTSFRVPKGTQKLQKTWIKKTLIDDDDEILKPINIKLVRRTSTDAILNPQPKKLIRKTSIYNDSHSSDETLPSKPIRRRAMSFDDTHYIKEETHVHKIFKDPPKRKRAKPKCSRCNRTGHLRPTCNAKTKFDGTLL